MVYNMHDFTSKLETYINHGYSIPIFQGYKAVEMRGAEKLIHNIYSSLPQDVTKSRKYLNDLEEKFNTGFHIANFVFVNIRQIEEILDKIHKTLPDEISQNNHL